MPFLGTACKAYSLLRKVAPIGVLAVQLAPRLTPWHSTLFTGTNSNTYYSPGLIRAGIQTIQRLMAMGGNMDSPPPPPHRDARLQGRGPETPAPPPYGPSNRVATHGNQTSFLGDLE